MKSKFKAGLVTAALAVGVVSTPGHAQDADNRAAQQAVNVRQSVMTLLSWSMGPLGGMARGNAEYDADIVGASADRLNAVAPMMVDAFAMDTRAAGLESRSRDAVWENTEDFSQKAQATIDAVARLKLASDSGDQQAAMAAVGAMGQTCGACHDAYRTD